MSFVGTGRWIQMTDAEEIMGMVLMATPVGDYDKRVVILTKERGKITAFARGARRPKSAMLAKTQPFVFGVFRVIEGKNAYTLLGAEISNYFMEIREDVVRTCYGTYFLELASYYGRENDPALDMLKLLYQTLRALCLERIDKRLIRCIYELKMFVVNGEYPECFHCIVCGGKDNLDHFSSRLGGVIYSKCREGIHPLYDLAGSVLYTMQYIIATPVEHLYTFQVTEEVQHKLRRLMDIYMKDHIDREFHSLDILKTLEIA